MFVSVSGRLLHEFGKEPEAQRRRLVKEGASLWKDRNVGAELWLAYRGDGLIERWIERQYEK